MHFTKQMIKKTITTIVSVFILLAVLSSCAANAKTDIKLMGKKGYAAHDITTFWKMANANVTTAYNFSDSDSSVIVLYFDSSSDAKSFYDARQNKNENFMYCSGNTVYWGDYRARTAFEGINASTGIFGDIIPIIIFAVILIPVVLFILKKAGLIEKQNGKWVFVNRKKSGDDTIEETKTSDNTSKTDPSKK